ncbi:probable E3 ubiquitin-protein ligase RHY1A [Corylus avellana]|uniref:probable E3 ubiquitin-protein ligase RHY1A n=1 Tax=Corylus avellana TaxID=13451 RepID=UPI001E23B4CA|nr:probable E3 ubiquitin-protein ligase RHY1A [Corylus avellana]
MTSASELFYTRRSRLGRSSPDLGFDRSSQYSHGSRRHHCDPLVLHHHHHRRDLGGGDPLRRSLHSSHHAERASVRLDQSTSQLVSSNSANTENLSRPRLSENERLPGAVLLARERLLERLRGVPLSGNRGSSRPSPYIYHSEPMLEEDIRGLFDIVRDTGTRISTGQSESSTITELTSQIERLQLLQEPKKKPPGLTQEALDCLRLEVFSSTVEGVAPNASQDCSICLETLLEGDELIRLPCGHRFHSACLDPWVRTCGDCPYCRRGIVVNSHRAMKTT